MRCPVFQSGIASNTNRLHFPHPVKLNRSCEVISILSKRSGLKEFPKISVKTDLSKADRAIESVARRDLINSGVEHRSLRLRYNSIYVSNEKYGSVIRYRIHIMW